MVVVVAVALAVVVVGVAGVLMGIVAVTSTDRGLTLVVVPHFSLYSPYNRGC
jgi:hypothetical protein